MHAPKIELRAHTYQYTTEIKIQVIKLEDLWLARHAQKKGRGGEGDKRAKGKREMVLFPLSSVPLSFPPFTCPFKACHAGKKT